MVGRGDRKEIVGRLARDQVHKDIFQTLVMGARAQLIHGAFADNAAFGDNGDTRAELFHDLQHVR